jgi:hypothetical protein
VGDIHNDWEPPPLCVDCRAPMSGDAQDHSRQGFGHQGRCCDCYERRQRNEKEARRG